MKRTITRRGALELIGAASMLPTFAVATRPAEKTVLFFTKSSGFEHDVVRRTGDRLSLAERTLTEIGGRRGFTVIATKDGRVFDGDLGAYDAFVFFTTGDLTEVGTDRAPPMSPAGKRALLAAIRNGQGFVGLHCASDTFHSGGERVATQPEPDPYIAMLGGEFLGHGSQQPARVRVADPGFAGLQGLDEEFTVTEEWYSLKNFAHDLHVLLVLETAAMQEPDYRRPPYPLAWARLEGRGRVYYNAIGHREDVWTSELFHQMLAGAVTWATGGGEADAVANLAVVTPHADVLPRY
jgi:type 1 glutamine amidotransferase